MKVALFCLIAIIGIAIGASMATYVFFGILTLVGMIAMIESIGTLRYLASRTTSLIDVLIFVGSVVATIQLGVTITASLVVAGLGYTLVYAPFLRKRRAMEKANERKEDINHWRNVL